MFPLHAEALAAVKSPKSTASPKEVTVVVSIESVAVSTTVPPACIALVVLVPPPPL